MDNARAFLQLELNKEIKNIQKSFFDITAFLEAQDLDNCEQLKAILNNDELAKKFMIFHENLKKTVRKKMLDSTGDANRNFEEILNNYDIQFGRDVEFQGEIK